MNSLLFDHYKIRKMINKNTTINNKNETEIQKRPRKKKYKNIKKYPSKHAAK